MSVLAVGRKLFKELAQDEEHELPFFPFLSLTSFSSTGQSTNCFKVKFIAQWQKSLPFSTPLKYDMILKLCQRT